MRWCFENRITLPRLRFQLFSDYLKTMLWSESDAWKLERYLDGDGETWVKSRRLYDWGDASETDFYRANDPARAQVSTFLRLSSRRCYDPRATLRDENNVWRRERYLDEGRETLVKKRCLMMMLDPKTEFLESSKQACQGSGFNFLQTIFRRCFDLRAMPWDESDSWMRGEKLGSESDARWWRWCLVWRGNFGEHAILPRLRIQLFSGYLIRIDGQSEKARGKTMLAQSSDAWRWEQWRNRGAMVRCGKRDSSQKRSLMLEAIPWC